MLVVLEKEGRKSPLKFPVFILYEISFKKIGERKGIQNQISILYCDKIIITIALFSSFLYLSKSETIVSSQNLSK